MNKNDQIYRDQHYVPKFYLRQFANESGFFHALDLNSSRILKPRPFSSACYEKFFYSEAGTLDANGQVFERCLGDLENTMAQDWNELLLNARNENLTLDNFEVLSWFLSLQWLRTKKFREEMRNRTDEFAKKALKVTLSILEARNDSRIEDYEAARRSLDDPSTTFSKGNAMHLQHIVRRLESFRNLFLSKSWNVIRSNNYEFITTDNPVVEWWPPADHFLGTPFIMRTHYVSLCPEILLELKPSNIDDIKKEGDDSSVVPEDTVEYRTASDGEVLSYNLILASFGHSHAYARNKRELSEILRQSQRKKTADNS